MELKTLSEEEEEEMEIEPPPLPPPNITQAIDLSDFQDLLQQLQKATSQSKLLKAIIKNDKDFCKLSTLQPQTEVLKKLLKGQSVEKRAKLVKLYDFSCEEDLFKTFLKTGMKNAENSQHGSHLISILSSIFKIGGEDGKIINPILGIQMILTHSKAEDIFLEVQKIKPKLNTENQSQITTTNELKHSSIKTELLKLWLLLTKSFTKISKLSGTENDLKILETSVPYLMQMYNASLSKSDRTIFQIIKLYASKKLQIPIESMPLFGPKCFENIKQNPLYAHSIRANSILSILNDNKAFNTCIQLSEDELINEEKDLEEFYDIRWILPLLTHTLDEKNICDVVKVISNGWIYFIARGLGLQDTILRNCALLAYKRIIFNLQLTKGFRLQDVKIWLHFLEGVKNGLSQLEECRLSNLLSIWMVATCEVLKQPSHLMYSKVTHFLLAKPVIDLTILPDFTHFFNAVDGNKSTREWILDILLKGLKTKEDWTIAKKVPTIKFMCLAFSLENISTQRLILKILANGSKIPEVAIDLVDRHSILFWISNVLIDDKRYYKRELEDVYRNLSTSCPSGSDRDQVFKFVSIKRGWEFNRVQQQQQQEEERTLNVQNLLL